VQCLPGKLLNFGQHFARTTEWIFNIEINHVKSFQQCAPCLSMHSEVDEYLTCCINSCPMHEWPHQMGQLRLRLVKKLNEGF